MTVRGFGLAQRSAAAVRRPSRSSAGRSRAAASPTLRGRRPHLRSPPVRTLPLTPPDLLLHGDIRQCGIEEIATPRKETQGKVWWLVSRYATHWFFFAFWSAVRPQQQCFRTCSGVLSSEVNLGWSLSNTTDEEPNDSEDDVANNTPHFEVYLFNTFRLSVDFPPIDEIVGDSWWVVIKTEHDRYFKFYMVQKDGYFSLHRGWELLVASENLEEQQMVMFEMETQDSFYIWNNDTS
ncbi:uncharacterized protein [Miscanthus floridulus]|uniref:uncharacterized protein n=1 Tax=Miscanthus floridulus TaxID=154761 RepID=UPI00345A8AB1